MNLAMSTPVTPPQSNLLVIEDDEVFGEHLREALTQRDFQVTLCADGKQGLLLAQTQSFDIVLLDILLPGLNGMLVLNHLRQSKRVPVILISALGDEQDRIAGFSSGADDYLPKPFSMDELQVRIEALMRRVAYERQQPVLQSSGLVHFDSSRQDVRLGMAWAGLTTTEYRLLEVFGMHAGELLSKPFLYQEVLHRGYTRHDRSLDMHVSNVRRKLSAIAAKDVRIEAVWGKGYVLRLPESGC